MKIINKKITAEKFLKLCDKFYCQKPTLEMVNVLHHGDFIAKIINEEEQTETNYFLQKIFIQKFDFPYSCHKNIKKGKELLITNFPVPKVFF